MEEIDDEGIMNNSHASDILNSTFEDEQDHEGFSHSRKYYKGYDSSLKKNIISMMDVYNRNPSSCAILKLIIGICFIFLPLLGIYLTEQKIIDEKVKYIFLPSFISVTLISSISMIYFVLKLGENCQNYGAFFPYWERKNIQKIGKIFIITLLLIWLLFSIESFQTDYNFIKQKVSQVGDKPQKNFDSGSFFLQILFILFFWEDKKNTLKYFEYKDSVIKEFKEIFHQFFIILIVIFSLGLIKLLLFETKNTIFYSLIYSILLYESIFFIFYPAGKESNLNNIIEDENYYIIDKKSKYLQVLPLYIVFILLIYLNYYTNILKMKKLYPYHNHESSFIINFLSIISFILITISILGLMFFITYISLTTITINLPKKFCETSWNVLLISFCLLGLGGSFPFGNFFLHTLFSPYAYEKYDYNCEDKTIKGFIIKAESEEKPKDDTI